MIRSVFTVIRLTSIASVLYVSQAHAAAFQLKENSAKALGRSFAGAASASGDAAIIVNNPAGMRQLDGRQFQADLSTVRFSAKYRGAPGVYSNGSSISGDNGGDAGMVALLPVSYFHIPFGDNNNLHLGTSLNVPFGFSTKYGRNWTGRYQGINSKLQAIDLGVALSYDINPYVSFGGAVFAERLSVDLSNAIDFGSILASLGVPSFAPGSADGYSHIKGNNTRGGFTLGGLFSVDENTHLGFSYRSQVEHKIDNGNVNFTVPSNAAAVLAVAAPGTFINTKGKATIRLPASATASFTHTINDRWSVMAEMTRTAWSKFDKVTIDFGSNQPDNVLNFSYRDSTFVGLGTDYRCSEMLTLRGGLGYDQTPTTAKYRGVRVPDNSRTWFSLGLTWKPSKQTDFNIGYAHLFISNPTVAQISSTGSTLAGDYNVNADLLSASINYKF
ncbi:outer membrane protein transport protein [Xylella taiwanensis]|uniref:Membrane protein n=1 Tax=Xylella taiwanensis TaxID=1444770 RepID=Z9JGR2_9GAMM|nr:outer membrane protein transport protein [Xylella taiwanensis]AXI82839.1 membrane protein [Xylella taiwanensis]EWS76996.1 membrane protein [Xylella taiwanensis]MCD8455849.1 outer membrane protein transport protein [Xylella taiwanensis]MCD8458253.1 outer membrane protein transport protein [Xylella taiwanensis]MCD8460391.1 outer membrane protein transport protein [Xylella taiwanensis]